MTEQKTLSLCMVVKNEEENISRCLQSIDSAVDEIIIVDTGSTDHTKDISERYGASVFDFSWQDDFSAARNEGIRRATGDWILWLDADEMVDQDDLLALQNAINTSIEKYLAIHLINFYGETTNIRDSFQVGQVRLFQNKVGVFFEGRIHEHLNIPNADQVTDIPVRVYHFGYMQNVMTKKHKHDRNIRMLNMEALDQPDNPWIYYHLASEYFNTQQYIKAFEHVNFALFRFLIQGMKPPAIVYRLKYLILLQHGSIDGALAGIDKAIEMYPDYVDLHYFKGILHFNKKRYAEALEAFHYCTILGEDNWHYLTMKGVGSFLAEQYIEKCIAEMSQ